MLYTLFMRDVSGCDCGHCFKLVSSCYLPDLEQPQGPREPGRLSGVTVRSLFGSLMLVFFPGASSMNEGLAIA